MYRATKHELLMSGSIETKTVYDLPGIGPARGGRLENAGIKSASELASLHKRMGRDEFELFLNRICGQNSMWTGMTIAALDEYEYSQTKVSFTLPQKESTMETASDSSILSPNDIQKAVGDQLKELSASIASLRSNTQQCKETNEELSYEINLNVNQIKKLSVIVELLLERVEKHAETCREQSQRISSSELKIVELNTIISLQFDEIKTHAETIKKLYEKNVALENDNFKLLSEKVKDFDLRIQKTEICRKSNTLFILTLSIVFVCIFIKNYFDKMNEILQLR